MDQGVTRIAGIGSEQPPENPDYGWSSFAPRLEVLNLDTTHDPVVAATVHQPARRGHPPPARVRRRTRDGGQELPIAMQMVKSEEEQSVIWRSRYLETEMPLRVYGHYGMPLLVFPTSGADCGEFERQGMIDALGDLLEAGRLKIFHVCSVNRQSFFNRSTPAERRLERQLRYDRYIHQEVVPFIYEHCRTPGIPIATAGCSFGAYHAINELLKHPDVFRRAVGMSGIYDVSRYCREAPGDLTLYYNNPVAYAPNLHDPKIRRDLDGCDIEIIAGRGAWEHPEWSEQLSAALASAAIPHRLDLWGWDVSHDWPWWRRQLRYVLERWLSA
ncbi:MAG: esterase family protein [Candidatus Xenobia bacterium]